MTLFVFQNPPNVFIKGFSVFFYKVRYSVFCTENNLIEKLSIGAHLFCYLTPSELLFVLNIYTPKLHWELFKLIPFRILFLIDINVRQLMLFVFFICVKIINSKGVECE